MSNEQNTVQIDWLTFVSQRQSRRAGEIIEDRALLVDGLLNALRVEVSTFVMDIEVRVAWDTRRRETEDETGENGSNNQLTVELIHLFEERKVNNSGFLVLELPDPEKIDYFPLSKQEIADVIDEVQYLNENIRALNMLSWRSAIEFCQRARQLIRHFEGFAGGDPASYSAESPEEF